MLFSYERLIGIKQLQELLPFGSSYSYDRILPLLSDTELQYIKPLLGDALYKRLLAETDKFTVETRMCRKAIANISLFQNFATLNTEILSGGFVRMSGEHTSTLYKYQETELKNTFRKNGYDGLDLIAEYFLTNIESFPEFKESEYFTSTKKEFVSSRFIVSKYYKNIGYIVFHHLAPFFRRAETLDLAGLVDLSLLREAMITEPTPEDKQESIEMVQAIIVLLGISYAIEDRGVNISETGVWLESKTAGDGRTEQNTLSLAETEKIVAKYRSLADQYKNKLTKEEFDTVYINPLIRDNNNKKTMML